MAKGTAIRVRNVLLLPPYLASSYPLKSRVAGKLDMFFASFVNGLFKRIKISVSRSQHRSSVNRQNIIEIEVNLWHHEI